MIQTRQKKGEKRKMEGKKCKFLKEKVRKTSFIKNIYKIITFIEFL